jgi:hypothetical protein
MKKKKGVNGTSSDIDRSDAGRREKEESFWAIVDKMMNECRLTCPSFSG